MSEGDSETQVVGWRAEHSRRRLRDEVLATWGAKGRHMADYLYRFEMSDVDRGGVLRMYQRLVSGNNKLPSASGFGGRSEGEVCYGHQQREVVREAQGHA